jgi:hypothetical protein
MQKARRNWTAARVICRLRVTTPRNYARQPRFSGPTTSASGRLSYLSVFQRFERASGLFGARHRGSVFPSSRSSLTLTLELRTLNRRKPLLTMLFMRSYVAKSRSSLGPTPECRLRSVKLPLAHRISSWPETSRRSKISPDERLIRACMWSSVEL